MLRVHAELCCRLLRQNWCTLFDGWVTTNRGRSSGGGRGSGDLETPDAARCRGGRRFGADWLFCATTGLADMLVLLPRSSTRPPAAFDQRPRRAAAQRRHFDRKPMYASTFGGLLSGPTRHPEPSARPRELLAELPASTYFFLGTLCTDRRRGAIRPAPEPEMVHAPERRHTRKGACAR